jgi:hypothetical protein
MYFWPYKNGLITPRRRRLSSLSLWERGKNLFGVSLNRFVTKLAVSQFFQKLLP